MAGDGLNPGLEADPAGRAVDAYLGALAYRLIGRRSARAAVVEELRDGLLEAVERHRDAGLAAPAAVGAAVTEFGEPAALAAAYRPGLAADQARRSALLIARSGPVVGLLWLGALAAGQPPRSWLEPGAVRLAALCLVLAVAAAMANAALAVAASGRLGRRLPLRPAAAPTAAATTGLICVAVDAAALTLFAVWAVTAPHSLAWAPLAAAASLTRAVAAGCAARRCLAARSTLTAPGAAAGASTPRS